MGRSEGFTFTCPVPVRVATAATAAAAEGAGVNMTELRPREAVVPMTFRAEVCEATMFGIPDSGACEAVRKVLLWVLGS